VAGCSCCIAGFVAEIRPEIAGQSVEELFHRARRLQSLLEGDQTRQDQTHPPILSLETFFSGLKRFKF
jgi:hypothetical protein